MKQRRRTLTSTSVLIFILLAMSPVFTAQRVGADADRVQLKAAALPAGTAAPTIDGKITDEAWLGVEAHATFTQTDPIEGAPASERTEVRVMFDKTHLFIGVICFDSDPSKIIANQSRRDADLSETDAIILVLDTFNDNQNAFVFGTNPLGIEYDGQVSGEGQTSGTSNNQQSGTGGSQRGTIGSLNLNWDGDWRVKSAITERGWEAEIAIPFKTLRYPTGEDRTWGFNLKRNIRRKNEQVYLASVQRGFDVYRISSSAKLTGLSLPPRRDLKVTPYALASLNKDYTAATKQVTRKVNPFKDRNVGIDAKWGVRPNLTADFTLNTDFAQVEADEEQVNLTRFDLFFPEKRGFFLENASVFQFGSPQSIDLFFSRRIGLSATGSTGTPIDIMGGARLSGKVAGYNIGLLNMQTDDAVDGRTGRTVSAANNFGVVRIQREVGRSSFGGIFVNREGTGGLAGRDNFNRAYGVDANIQVTTNGKLFAFLARTDSPAIAADRLPHGSDQSGRIFYNFTNNLWQLSGGYSFVGNDFNPEAGYLPRRGYRRPEFRAFFQPQPKRWPWIRRISPHTSYNAFYGINDGLVQSSMGHFHFLEIQPRQGGRFGTFVDRNQDRPTIPFTVFNAGGKSVVIPPGLYTWYQIANEYLSDPSAVVSATFRWRHGGFYDGDFDGFESSLSWHAGKRFIGSFGYTRQNITLKNGQFHTDLVPLKLSYAFTTLASVQALVQYNNQSSLLTSNIRLAFLNRSGTGLFIVYNDRRDTTTFNPIDTLGRSFIVKYTRLFDM